MAAQMLQMDGLQKAAVLLIALGAELSAKILKQNFDDDEIERLTYTISNMGQIPAETKDLVISEFKQLFEARQYILQGGVSYAREMLEKAIGPARATELIKKLTTSGKILPFTSLRKTDPRHLLSFLQNEHPQTIALTMAYLQPEQAALVLAGLREEVQADVAKRIAEMERASVEIVDEVEKVLESKLSNVVQEDRTRGGGVDVLVGILNAVDRATEKKILEELEREDPALAEEVRKRMFVFEDIVKLDDIFIQRILREVDTKDLAVALRGANEEVRNRVFRNQSQRAAKMLKDEIEYMGPVRLRDVEEAQQRIVKVIRSLEESGEIIISRGGEDAILV